MGVHKTIIVQPDLKIEQLVKEIINSIESQIVIEIPKDCSLLTNEINLRLLKFYAEEEEKEIIINATDPVLISLAQRLGISTIKESEIATADVTSEESLDFHYRGQLESAAAPEVESEVIPRKELSPQGRLIPAILVLLFTFIIAVWWFLQPKAVVVIYPKVQEFNFETDALISSAFGDTDISTGKIPAVILEKSSKVISQTLTSGHRTIGFTQAYGKIMLINSTSQPVLVPKGTIVTGRQGVRFLTDNDVLVPKKSAKLQSGVTVGEEYGRAEVGISAEKKGISGNQPAKSITKIEDKYQRFLNIVNLLPTQNGSDKKIPVVTLEDAKKGESEVKRQMLLAAPEEASALVSRDYLYLSDLVKSEVIRIINKPEIGAEGESVQTELEYRILVLAPTLIGIQKFLTRQFDRNIPANFESKGQKIKMLSAKVLATEEELARLEFVGQGSIKGILNQSKIKELIKGKSISAAKDVLARQNEIADLKINLNDRNGKLPRFGFQIKVIFPASPKNGNER